jgi:hypothetical protein
VAQHHHQQYHHQQHHLHSSMNLLLDYQQIIIKSTYERNNVAFAPAADCATSLRALMRMLRRDMESFVAAGESTDFYLLCISILSSIFSRCFLGFVMASSNLFKKFPTSFFFFFFFFFFHLYSHPC